jgi:hypothetical protein
MLRGKAMMLAADRVDANLDFRQAITIYIYRPNCRSRYRGFTYVLTGVRGAKTRSAGAAHTCVEPGTMGKVREAI